MVYIFFLLIIVSRSILWGADFYINKISQNGIFFKLCKTYRDFCLTKETGCNPIDGATFIFIFLIIFLVGFGICDYVNVNEGYRIIESDRGEARGYIYNRCATRNCRKNYFRVKIDDSLYKSTFPLYPDLKSGDSITIYYNKKL